MKEDRRIKGDLKKRRPRESLHYHGLPKKNGCSEQERGNADFHMPRSYHLALTSKSALLEPLSFSMKQGGLDQDEESLVCLSALTRFSPC